jgi:hypothetical protein
MNNFKLISIVFFTLTVIFSCKNIENKESETKNELTVEPNKSANIDAFYPMLNQKELGTLQVSNYRLSAQPILEFRQKESGNKSYTILDKDIWAYKFVAIGSEISKPADNAGKWINFKEDLTYEYGLKSKVLGNGRYHYDFDKGVILLLDNDKAIKPSEYRVKPLMDAMVFEGTSTYEDNNIQAKLERIEKLPE